MTIDNIIIKLEDLVIDTITSLPQKEMCEYVNRIREIQKWLQSLKERGNK